MVSQKHDGADNAGRRLSGFAVRFPRKLKLAKNIPIFKKDDEHDFNNYRPISLLPSTNKEFEKKTIYILNCFSISL